ncbi:DUF6924 domain-containing protein [Rhodococcoides yunnanense]|uniref:DUF6924 domain-containing protein n=1 Tax=Rhodococcoides yunnanense TaxID=278209 RepID=UPI00093562BF|nr:hypothetical protein [Rhodococcus yunnanensis]
MVMSWAQIRGSNYSTIGRTIRAVVFGPGDSVQRVRHAPPSRWRIDDADGNPVFIENATDTYRRADDGVMLHTAKSPHDLVARIGFPSTLLHAYESWPPITAGGFPSQRMVDPSEPQPVQVRGRDGWEVSFREQHSTERTTYVFDAQYGVALSWQVGEYWMELEDPVLDENFDHEVFTWTGPSREQKAEPSNQAQLDHERKQQVIGEIPRALPSWLPTVIGSHPQDGDPRTGALDLTVYSQQTHLMLRRWVTAIGEPELEWPSTLTPARHRQVAGVWTYEIRSNDELDAADCTRIVESIVPVDPPGRRPDEIAAELDAERAAAREAEILETLGTGRILDDHLGGGESVFIRTDFTDDAAWREVALAAMAPVQSGGDTDFEAYLTCIDNPAYDGLTAERLLELIGDLPTSYAFLVDNVTVTHREHPIVVLDSNTAVPDHLPGRTFRVIPAEMWNIENNLSIANMDFETFADGVDPDGIFRGFPEPVAHLTSADLVQIASSNTSTDALVQFHEAMQEWEYPYAIDVYQRGVAQLQQNAEELEAAPGATLIGYEEFLDAISTGDPVLSTVVPLEQGGWWTVVLDQDRRLLAAMLFSQVSGTHT